MQRNERTFEQTYDSGGGTPEEHRRFWALALTGSLGFWLLVVHGLGLV